MEDRVNNLERDMQALRDAIAAAKAGRPLSERQSMVLDEMEVLLDRVKALGWLISQSKWLIAGTILLYSQWDRLVETLRIWGETR